MKECPATVLRGKLYAAEPRSARRVAAVHAMDSGVHALPRHRDDRDAACTPWRVWRSAPCIQGRKVSAQKCQRKGLLNLSRVTLTRSDPSQSKLIQLAFSLPDPANWLRRARRVVQYGVVSAARHILVRSGPMVGTPVLPRGPHEAHVGM